MAKELAFRRSAMIEGRLHEPLPSIIRGKMENRRAVVMSSTRSATRNEIEETVAALMMAYPSMRGLSHIEAQVLIRKYADDLADMPLWAIKAAARDISRGAVSDMSPDFAPSAPRVRQLADEHLEWCKKELRDLKAILTADVEPPANPEMRARINLGFRKLHENLSGKYVVPPEPPKPQAMTAEQLKQHYQKHGLAFQPKEQPEQAE
ncbi:hypothetical protein [Bradyrhizobium sp. AZCC 1578]|uniref:hypothetical protein n=1 Tax=Bradyrhizobium sp. AZCC 1578 TaxID=3117027 RepID=UPI002FF3B27C